MNEPVNSLRAVRFKRALGCVMQTVGPEGITAEQLVIRACHTVNINPDIYAIIRVLKLKPNTKLKKRDDFKPLIKLVVSK